MGAYGNEDRSVSWQRQDRDKRGDSCITAFFGFVSVGDASIEAAMKNGGIKKDLCG